MARILVAEDSPTHTKLICSILESADHLVDCAEDGQQAIDRVNGGDFDLIVSDLNMPVLNGCDMVEQLTASHPQIPIVVVTARGSESLAVDALAIGAADFVPKDSMAGLLNTVVEQLIRYRVADHATAEMAGRLRAPEFYFKLQSDVSCIPVVAEYLIGTMAAAKCGTPNLRYRVAAAVARAVFNAIEYGNLEADALAGEPGAKDGAADRSDERNDLVVRLKVSVADSDTRVSVSHEGKGSLTRTSPAPGTPESFQNEQSRGLVLMTSFMDDVMFNRRCNEVTMVKRHD